MIPQNYITAWSRVALAPLSGAHVNGAPVLLMPIAGRPVAPERGQRRGQTPIQFAATSFESAQPPRF